MNEYSILCYVPCNTDYFETEVEQKMVDEFVAKFIPLLLESLLSD